MPRPFITFCAILAAFAAAHPGQDISQEVRERSQWLSQRNVDLHRRCSSAFDSRDFYNVAKHRRRRLFADLRSKRGLDHHGSGPRLSKRDVDDVLNTDHNQTLQHPTWGLETPEKLLFDDNSSCILQPEGRSTEGPYYVQGEYIRDHLIENQKGVGKSGHISSDNEAHADDGC